jgi:cytochrome c oxidase cbb3-type subunit III
MPTKIEKDLVTGTQTTGHEWDGIKELDTPLPKWWIYVFYATIAWALAYYVLYPAWPSLSSHTSGIIGFSSRSEIREQLAEQAKQRAPFLDRLRAEPLDRIESQADLLNFAIAGGRATFLENCAPCHGSGGAGAKSFPSLADDDWLWGGSREAILQTVTHGIRNADADSRQSQMPRFGTDGVLKKNEINDVAEYVLSLSSTGTDKAAAERGKPIFAENCAACHGEKGEGNQEVGAPNLSDKIWLYGGRKADVVETITNARAGSMPSWSGRLDEATIKMLTIYVHSLGGGK